MQIWIKGQLIEFIYYMVRSEDFNHLKVVIFYLGSHGVPFINLFRGETNIRNVTNEPFSKRTNIRIFVRFDD